MTATVINPRSSYFGETVEIVHKFLNEPSAYSVYVHDDILTTPILFYAFELRLSETALTLNKEK